MSTPTAGGGTRRRPPAAAVPAGLVVGLLALTAIFGTVAVQAATPHGKAIGVWPVAFGTVALLVAPRRWALPLTAALAGLGVGVIALVGRPFAEVVALGVGTALQPLVTATMLRARGQLDRWGRPALFGLRDLVVVQTAIALGTLVMALCGLVGGALTPGQSAGLLALAVGTATLASEVTLLPLWCRLSRTPATAGTAERAAQWLVLLGLTGVVFWPTDFPSLVLLVFPALAWVAVRCGPWEAMAKMLSVEAAVFVLTRMGHGPLARPDRIFDVPPQTQGILLATFTVVTALQVLVLRVSIGQHHDALRRIAAERDRIRGIVESISSVAIIGADPDGMITLFNPGAERLLGYRAEEVIGRSTQLLHVPAAITAKARALGVEDDFATVARSLMDAGPTEMTFVRSDGTPRQHQMSLHRVLDDHGRTTGFVSTSEDVTDTLAAQAAVVDALEAEKRASESLREVDRVKDAFVSSVSHELRTPLTSILGYLELLQDGSYGPLGRRQDGAVERIRQNCTRLLTLISDLLDLGRLQEGDQAPTEPLDLVQVVRTATAVVAPTAYARVVRLAQRLPDHPLPVIGVPGPLERVVINLVGNAVKFTDPDGRVDVHARADGDEAVVEVSDTGMGIPLAEQERLFDRFFRSSLAQAHAVPGSGLGLSIARSVVEQHGGRLSVESAPGVGSTFRVHLPLARVGGCGGVGVGVGDGGAGVVAGVAEPVGFTRSTG